ncbi:MAG: hypothetical protein Q8936_06135 [Bacillota bacterium]|nr:hypothetical protein [Bacillota bacterium]
MNNFGGQLQMIFVIGLMIIYLFYIQIAKRPVKAGRYVIMPLILIYAALGAVGDLKNTSALFSLGTFILVTVSLVLGVVSGLITKIFKGEDGILYQQGGWKVAVFLLIAFPLKFILRHYLGALPGNEFLNNQSTAYLLIYSVQVTARSITVFFRCPEVFSSFSEQKMLRKRLRRASRGKAV